MNNHVLTSIKKLLTLLIVLALSISFSGCGPFLRMQEEKIYKSNLDSLFDALDRDDADAVKALFSKNVLDNCRGLDGQIEKLLSVYPGAESEIKFTDLIHGSYRDADGKHKSTACAEFPIVNGNEYYWVFVELIYQDDFSPDNVGFNRVYFYTADEYCRFYHSDETYPSDIGLYVFSEHKFDNPVRCINNYPYEFKSFDRSITSREVEGFLNSSRQTDAFVARFGEPNAKDTYGNFYYEIADNDGSTVYLELGIENNEILYANLLGKFQFIRIIVEESVE